MIPDANKHDDGYHDGRGSDLDQFTTVVVDHDAQPLRLHGLIVLGLVMRRLYSPNRMFFEPLTGGAYCTPIPRRSQLAQGRIGLAHSCDTRMLREAAGRKDANLTHGIALGAYHPFLAVVCHMRTRTILRQHGRRR